MQPVCGCRDHGRYLERYYHDGETDFWRCRDCSMVLRDPMPTLDDLDRLYLTMYNASNIVSGSTSQESGEFALQQYCRFLKNNLISAGVSVLDYGCGTGYVVKSLREEGINAAGLERSAGARQFAREQRQVDLLASIDEVRDDSVGLVTMIEVIEHLPDPMIALLDIKQKLQPGGVVFITTPNRNGFRARREGGYWREATKKFHVVLFDPGSLKTILQTAGFAAVQKVIFSPVQRTGGLVRLLMRIQQLLGLSGTICFLAKKPD